MRDQPYYLPQHVYACRTDEGVIFLDAKRDRYLGLGGAGVAALPDFISNWAEHRCGAASAQTSISHGELQRLADSLIERGLLRRCSGEESPKRRSSAPPLTMDLPRGLTEAHEPVRPLDVFNFTIACVEALWLLQRLPLEAIASRVTAARHDEKSLEPVEVFVRVQAFRRLRRLFFSEKDRCLLNSLALVLFLRRYGHFPLFVIGVKTRPFAAHSWVQHDQILLEGNPASVCHFTPILVA